MNDTSIILFGFRLPFIAFLVIIVELIFFCFQAIYYQYRPSEKSRLRYLLLITFLLYYNIITIFFPNAEQIPLPDKAQYIVAYSAGVPLSMYFAYYLYKLFEFQNLHFLSTRGPFLFILLPFLFLFIPTYIWFENLFLSIQLLVIIPAFYIVAYLLILGKAIYKGYRTLSGYEKSRLIAKTTIVGFALILWTTLPIWTILGPEYENMELIFTNAGFVVMTFDYISTTIANSKNEYNELLRSGKALKEINEKLTLRVKERTKKLEETNEKIINTFVNIAHETKTPLMLINNYLDDFVLEERHNHRKKELQIVKNHVARLTDNIINFFDVEKFRKGFFVYEHNKVTNLSKLLSDAAELYRYYEKSKNIKIIEKIEPDILIKADPEAISRVINNLLENAVKFNKQNGHIELTLVSDESQIIFTIKDTGTGIAPDHLKNIFEPYYQINKKNKSSSGMGMGLAVVKNIIHNLNGKISVQSAIDSGTEFTISLTRYQGTESPVDYKVREIHRQHEEVNDEVKDEVRPTLMIIEDSPGLLHYLVLKLKERYNLYVARNGVEALKKLNGMKTLDIIITDVMMDMMDGIEFFKILKDDHRFSHVPLIFISAKDNREKSAALALGAIDYIKKPFLISELLNKVESILKILEKQKIAIIKQASKSIFSGAGIDRADNLERFKQLTTREKEIVERIKEGESHKEISELLNISQKTVAKHIQNIYDKLNVSSKTELLHKIYSPR